MDRSELTMAVAGALVAAFLLGWIFAWIYGRMNAPGHAAHSDMAGELHAAEEARRRAELRLAEAEARVHGTSPDEVHFHEVGGLDSIADVVGTCEALRLLGVSSVSASALCLGAGRIRAVFDPALASLPNLGVLVVLAVGVSRVASGATSAGDVVTVAYLLTIVSFPIRAIGWLLGEFPRSVVGYRRAKAVLEVRSLDIPFILEDGQIVGRLVYDRLTEIPDQIYGERIGSHYQAQGLKLSKHFKQE